MPPVHRATAVTAQPRTSAPALRVDELIERLATTEGNALGDQLFARVAPHLRGEEMLEPYVELQNPPRDRLGKALVTAWQESFVFAATARSALPGALANALLPFTDKKGALDVKAVERDFGPDFGAWLKKLAGVSADAAVKPIADRLTWDSVADYDRDQMVAASPSIAPRLEALDFTLRRYGRPDELKGFKFLGLQHLFATTARLFGAVNQLGVKPDDCYVIGKNYSTNWRVSAELEAKGMKVDGVSRDLGNNPDFAKAMGDGIERQLTSIIQKLPQPVRTVHDAEGTHFEWAEPPRPQVLLIDDGAEAIKLLHEKYPQWAPFFACVEQTRRGARIAHELADKGLLKCAVVNVAESWAKLQRESPMIGQSVVAEVSRKLDRLERSGLPRPSEATVIGYGAVGQAVAKALQARGLTVHVYDRDPDVLAKLPPGMVGHSSKSEALTHGAVTVSCVGARTLWPEDWDWLPNGAVLVNAASADDELGPQDLRELHKAPATIDASGESWGVFNGQPISLGHPSAEAHSDSMVKLASGKELLLASNGFVVNMTGERDPIPPRFIQLTRALLLMGAMTATRATKPGLIDVPEDWQKALVAQIESQLAQQGESLQKPLWDAVVEAMPAPPAAAVEAARREREAAKGERAGAVRAPTVTGQAHGYPLGRAAKGTYAYEIATSMNLPDRELTVESAALFHASRFANQAMGWHLTVKFNPDVPGRVGPEKLLAPPKNAAAAKANRDETLFAAHFGLHSAGLAYQALTTQLKAPPSLDQLAGAMVKIAREAEVSLAPYLEYLKSSPDPDNAALAAALAPKL